MLVEALRASAAAQMSAMEARLCALESDSHASGPTASRGPVSDVADGVAVIAEAVAPGDATIRAVRATVAAGVAVSADAVAVSAVAVVTPNDETTSKRRPSLSYAAAIEELGGSDALSQYKDYVARLYPRQDQRALYAELRSFLPSDFRLRAAYSTRVLNQRYVSDLDELYEDAARVQGSYAAFVRDVAARTGAAARAT